MIILVSLQTSGDEGIVGVQWSPEWGVGMPYRQEAMRALILLIELRVTVVIFER